MIITLISSDMPLRAVIWVGVLSIWAPVGLTPFPVPGLIPVSFVTVSIGLFAASLCKGLNKFLCLVMVLCMEETLVTSA